MNSLKYPILKTDGVNVVIFISATAGYCIGHTHERGLWNSPTVAAGDFKTNWLEDRFTISGEYLKDSFGKFSGREHKNLIKELAKNSGLEICRDDRCRDGCLDGYFTFNAGGALSFWMLPHMLDRAFSRYLEIPNFINESRADVFRNENIKPREISKCNEVEIAAQRIEAELLEVDIDNLSILSSLIACGKLKTIKYSGD